MRDHNDYLVFYIISRNFVTMETRNWEVTERNG